MTKTNQKRQPKLTCTKHPAKNVILLEGGLQWCGRCGALKISGVWVLTELAHKEAKR